MSSFRRIATRLLEALLAAALGTWLLAFVVATYRMQTFAVTSSDFDDYCMAVDTFARGNLTLWPAQRSVLAATLPGLLATKLGVLSGLVHATIISTGGWLAAIWLWAAALGGRRAGWLAVAWTPCFGALVMLSRTVSFYPEIAWIHALSAAMVAGALARGGPSAEGRAWLAGAVASCFVVPLADVWSLMLLLALLPSAVLAGVLGGASATPPPVVGRDLLRRRLLRGAETLGWSIAPLGAVALAWEVGPWSYPGHAASLQVVVQAYARDAALLGGVGWEVPPDFGAGDFVWGKKSMGEVLPALRYLLAVEDSRPAELARAALQQPGSKEITRFGGYIGGAAALALAGVAWRGREGAARRGGRVVWRPLVALVLTCVPFALLLRSAILTLPHPRQLALGALFLPVIFGLGSATILRVVEEIGGRAAGRWRTRAWVRARARAAELVTARRAEADDTQGAHEEVGGFDPPVAATEGCRVGDRPADDRSLPPWLGPALTCAGLLVVVALVTGVLPTQLTPRARWRQYLTADEDPRASIAFANGEDPGVVPRRCAAILATDARRGHPAVVPYFPAAPEGIIGPASAGGEGPPR